MKGVVRVEAKVRADKTGRLHLDNYTTTRKPRDVPLPKDGRHELARHIEGHDVAADGLLFTFPDGGLLSHRTWNRGTWAPAVAAVGLPQATFHSLRHFCATTLLRNKVSHGERTISEYTHGVASLFRASRGGRWVGS
jgi:integrase